MATRKVNKAFTSGHEKEIVTIVSAELDDIKNKCEKERAEKEALQTQLNALIAVKDNSTFSLFQANELNEKQRQDINIKAGQILQMKKEMGVMEDRLKQLELRASEVDQAEINLETTKRTLENCQQQLTKKEREFDGLATELAATTKNLKKLQETNDKYRYHVTDLQHQVREELHRNAKIEQEIGNIENLKELLGKAQHQADSKQLQVDELVALLSSTRKLIADLQHKIQETEKSSSAQNDLRQQLEFCHQEIETLKQFSTAKDRLILQKNQALEYTKDAITVIKKQKQNGSDDDHIRKLVEKCSELISEVQTATHDRSGRLSITSSSLKSLPIPAKLQKVSTHHANPRSHPDHQARNTRSEINVAKYNKFQQNGHVDVYELNHPVAGKKYRQIDVKLLTRNQAKITGKQTEYVQRYTNLRQYRPMSAVESRRGLANNSPYNGSVSPGPKISGHSERNDIKVEQLINSEEIQMCLKSAYYVNLDKGRMCDDQVTFALLNVGDRVRVKPVVNPQALSKGVETVKHRYGKTTGAPVYRRHFTGIIKFLDENLEKPAHEKWMVGVNCDQSNNELVSLSHVESVPVDRIVAKFHIQTADYIPMSTLRIALKNAANLEQHSLQVKDFTLTC